MRKLIFAVIFSGVAAVVSGATYEVSDLEDLRLKLSNVVVEGDEIVLNPGTYLIPEEASGLEVSKDNITLSAKGGRDETIIDGQSKVQLLKVRGKNFTVKGITFKDGFNQNQGGAINIDHQDRTRTAKIVDCRFIGCKAMQGGAIYAKDEEQADYCPRSQCGLISGCSFEECAVSKANGCGGAVCGSIWIEDSVFDACSIDVTSGGAGYGTSIAALSHMTVTNCVFKNQSVGYTSRCLVGRGQDVFQRWCEQGSVRLLDCVISSNTTTIP